MPPALITSIDAAAQYSGTNANSTSPSIAPNNPFAAEAPFGKLATHNPFGVETSTDDVAVAAPELDFGNSSPDIVTPVDYPNGRLPGLDASPSAEHAAPPPPISHPPADEDGPSVAGIDSGLLSPSADSVLDEVTFKLGEDPAPPRDSRVLTLRQVDDEDDTDEML